MARDSIIKNLSELLSGVMADVPAEARKIEVNGITADSRQVTPGSLFVAIRGEHSDGHDYIQQAVKNGCVAVIAESAPVDNPGVPLFIQSGTRSVIGHLASAFYDFPTREMIMIGITGTNGKTTSSYILEKLIQAAGGEPGVMGTINIRYLDVVVEANLTTPEAIELHKYFRMMADRGVTHVIMEVSSHGLEQERVSSIMFDVALFTNLSRDHLDFHGSMESYFVAKKKLFTRHLKRSGTAVVVLNQNRAEKKENWGRRLAEFIRDETDFALITCGIEQGDTQAVECNFNLHGSTAEIKTDNAQFHLQVPLVGAFNLENVLGCVTCGMILGYQPETMCNALRSLGNIPGRLERVTTDSDQESNGEMVVFVDYAHTPEALQHVLGAIRTLTPNRLVVVFGCGGDRDKGKRRLMGKAAGSIADISLITSDNPRSESPQKILADIEKGLQEISVAKIDSAQVSQNQKLKGYDIIESRRGAIRRAIEVGRSGDVVLICGKGHESYQITGSDRIFFDDRKEAREQLRRIRQAA
jgi:UDP-N-acetylmuramyl-tripeptide synthetase